MGYPSEIPNAIPARREPPRRSSWSRFVDRLHALVRVFFPRRRRHRADAPELYGQGVDRNAPPLRIADRARLDFDEIARAVESRPRPRG
jgi:hypothetical protein